MPPPDGLTIGVEEEFFLVDPRTGDLSNEGWPGFERFRDQFCADSGRESFDREYQLSIIESRTGVCRDLGRMRAELRTLRLALVGAAADAGLAVVSAGTLPLGDWRAARITPKPRCAEITAHYREPVERRVTCGCHVHVGFADRDLAVQVLNRVQPWLPVLLALSSSSPFFEGADTGYSSYRTVLWNGFPVAGPPFPHRSHAEYERTVQLLLDTGSMLDRRSVYWDARLGVGLPTLEFRVADGCTTIDEAVLQVALSRALALTCRREVERGEPLPEFRPELLLSARWRAARSGLEDRLIDVAAAEFLPADEVVDRFLAYLRDALDELGDWDEVSGLVEQTRRRGTSARRQHAVLARAGRLMDVCEAMAAETLATGPT